VSISQRLVTHSAASEYHKLMRALAARAMRLGSRDPESAAQEAVQRSLANAAARPALDYYFNEAPPLDPVVPAWTLLQLLGWLHGVLRFVVWEERARIPDDLVEVLVGQLTVAERRHVAHLSSTRRSLARARTWRDERPSPPSRPLSMSARGSEVLFAAVATALVFVAVLVVVLVLNADRNHLSVQFVHLIILLRPTRDQAQDDLQPVG